DTSPSAIVVDPNIPASSLALRACLDAQWPRLAGRIADVREPIEGFTVDQTDLVVSSHACGSLTDRVIDTSVAARARVAVLSCCHDFETCDRGALSGWMDGTLAIDAMRAMRLEQAGYRVWTQTIPGEITDKNRLLLGEP